MANVATRIANKPAWIDLGSTDAAASRRFYEQLFGWKVTVNPDPQYGGYGLAQLDDKDAAGIGPTQSPDQPTAWSFYIGTEDLDRLSQQVEAAGGRIVSPAFDVGDQGRMAVYLDPVGAFISAWEPKSMIGFKAEGRNAFGWAELNARGVEDAIPFYQRVFGWTIQRSTIAGAPDYVEFQVDGESIAGAQEMQPDVPIGVPNHWLVYFGVDDVDSAFRRATGLGAREIAAPQDFPGGRFAIVSDPQGASFGLLKLFPR